MSTHFCHQMKTILLMLSAISPLPKPKESKLLRSKLKENIKFNISIKNLGRQISEVSTQSTSRIYRSRVNSRELLPTADSSIHQRSNKSASLKPTTAVTSSAKLYPVSVRPLCSSCRSCSNSMMTPSQHPPSFCVTRESSPTRSRRRLTDSLSTSQTLERRSFSAVYQSRRIKRF